MTIFQIDEFVICEYAAWDGNFTPPTSEWSPDARQLSPTNGSIELPLYIRPGFGDGIVVSAPEDAVIVFTVYTIQIFAITISSPDDAVIQVQCDVEVTSDIAIPSPESAVLQLNNLSSTAFDTVIPSPENAVLQLSSYPMPGMDIILPSSEEIEIHLEGNSMQNIQLSVAAPSTQNFILLNQALPSSSIVIPSTEDVGLVLALTTTPTLSTEIINQNIFYNISLTDRIRFNSNPPGVTFNIEIIALLLLEDFLNKYFLDIAEVLGLSDGSKARLGLLISEYLIVTDSHIVKWNGTKTVTDSFSIYENIKLQFIKTISEALTIADSPSAMLGLLLSEFITFTETTLPNWNTTRTVNENITLTDSVVQALQLFITESLILTDVQVVQLQLFLAEFVSLSESAIPNWNSTRTVNDDLTLTDILYQQLTLILTEALTCTDSTPLCQLGLAIYEYLGFTEMLSSPGRFSVGATDTLDATDSLNFGYAQVISDVFSLVDAADTIRLLLNTIAENLGLSESISASLNSVLPVAESLILIDTVTSQGRLYNIVHDTLLLNVVVELDGEVWECYVLNTPKFLPSIYSGFNFNSYCVFQNRAYGCKSDGIYELTGDTDNGTVINTGVQLSETKFGLPNQKRFRKAYIGVSGTTPLLSMETETGETKTYSIDTDGEVDASRSLRSKKWKLTVTDFESLDFIKLVPVVLAK